MKLRLLAAVVVCFSSARAQILIDSRIALQVLRQLDQQPASPLECTIRPVAPILNFSFRLETGYVARVSLRQFRGPNHWVAALSKVTPVGESDSKAVYLLRRFDLPDVPATEFTTQLAGAFLVGEGSYQANTVLFDDARRACRVDWPIEVKNPPKAALESANRVLPIFETLNGAWKPDAEAARARITIFLHAAPLNPRSSNLEATDVVMAVTSLMTLLEQLPARSVRLVVFNLLRDKELYRTDSFNASDIEPMTRALDSAQLGMVDYRTLQQQTVGHDLLSDLIEREVNEPSRSDAVIFLGPDGAATGRKERAAAPKAVAAAAPIFFLQYRLGKFRFGDGVADAPLPPKFGEADPRPLVPCLGGSYFGCNNMSGRGDKSPSPADLPTGLATQANTESAANPDAIASMMRKIKGKTFVVRDAVDFAQAVGRIEKAQP